MILAGDIGGTNTRLAVFEHAGGQLTPTAEATFRSREHPSLEAVLRKFRAAHPLPVDRACVGVAGPVRQG
ncbi:MAG: glucokinase, partial [Candidatus Methylomirabilota bacterium]